MASIGDLIISLFVDDRRFAADVTKSAGKAGDAAGKRLASGINKGLAGLGIATGVTAVVAQLTNFLRDSTEAFREDQASVAQLGAALRSNVADWDGNTAAIERTLGARMELGFSDDEQRESLTKLVGAYGNVTEALDTQRIAMDLARFSGKSLADASQLLINVHAGNFRGLRQLGISTKGVKTETQALGLIMRKVGGQAASYAETDLGKLDRANIRINESQERIGAVLSTFGTEILPVVADGLEAVVEHFGALGEAIDDLPDLPFDVDVGDVFGTIGDGARGLIDPLAVLKTNMIEEAIAAEKAKQANEEWGESFRAGERGMDNAGGAADALGDDLDELGEDVEPVQTKFERLTEAIEDTDDALAELSEAMFGPEEKLGDLAEAQQELADLLAEGPGDRPGDYTIWQGKIAATERKIFDLHAEMARSAGPQAFYDWLVKQEKALDKTDTELLTYIGHLKWLAQLQGGGLVPDTGAAPRRTVGLTPRAEGGPVWADTPYMVGERGREMFVPDTSGMIVPNRSLASMASPSLIAAAVVSQLIGLAGQALGDSPAVGGNNYSTTIVMADKPTRDPFETLERASRYQRFGTINPPVNDEQ